MAFTDDIRQALLNRVGKGRPFANRKKMADELEVDPSQLNRFLSGERGLNATSLGKILDRLGATVRFPDDREDASREVSFVPVGTASSGQPSPGPEDYLAVPLCPGPEAASPGYIPEAAVDGWLLVWRHHSPLAGRSNLVAVPVPEGDYSMSPSLHPGDIVLVDRDDRRPDTGRLMLVRSPAEDAPLAIRRVSALRTDSDTELVLYSDNSREYPPTTHLLERDYQGDLDRAIGGSVVWAWNDMSRK